MLSDSNSESRNGSLQNAQSDNSAVGVNLRGTMERLISRKWELTHAKDDSNDDKDDKGTTTTELDQCKNSDNTAGSEDDSDLEVTKEEALLAKKAKKQAEKGKRTKKKEEKRIQKQKQKERETIDVDDVNSEESKIESDIPAHLTDSAAYSAVASTNQCQRPSPLLEKQGSSLREFLSKTLTPEQIDADSKNFNIKKGQQKFPDQEKKEIVDNHKILEGNNSVDLVTRISSNTSSVVSSPNTHTGRKDSIRSLASFSSFLSEMEEKDKQEDSNKLAAQKKKETKHVVDRRKSQMVKQNSTLGSFLSNLVEASLAATSNSEVKVKVNTPPDNRNIPSVETDADPLKIEEGDNSESDVGDLEATTLAIRTAKKLAKKEQRKKEKKERQEREREERQKLESDADSWSKEKSSVKSEGDISSPSTSTPFPSTLNDMGNIRPRARAPLNAQDRKGITSLGAFLTTLDVATPVTYSGPPKTKTDVARQDGASDSSCLGERRSVDLVVDTISADKEKDEREKEKITLEKKAEENEFEKKGNKKKKEEIKEEGEKKKIKEESNEENKEEIYVKKKLKMEEEDVEEEEDEEKEEEDEKENEKDVEEEKENEKEKEEKEEEEEEVVVEVEVEEEVEEEEEEEKEIRKKMVVKEEEKVLKVNANEHDKEKKREISGVETVIFDISKTDLYKQLEEVRSKEINLLQKKINTLESESLKNKEIYRNKLEASASASQSSSCTCSPRHSVSTPLSMLQNRLLKLNELKKRIEDKIDNIDISDPSSPQLKHLFNIKDSLSLAIQVCEASMNAELSSSPTTSSDGSHDKQYQDLEDLYASTYQIIGEKKSEGADKEKAEMERHRLLRSLKEGEAKREEARSRLQFMESKETARHVGLLRYLEGKEQQLEELKQDYKKKEILVEDALDKIQMSGYQRNCHEGNNSGGNKNCHNYAQSYTSSYSAPVTPRVSETMAPFSPYAHPEHLFHSSSPNSHSFTGHVPSAPLFDHSRMSVPPNSRPGHRRIVDTSASASDSTSHGNPPPYNPSTTYSPIKNNHYHNINNSATFNGHSNRLNNNINSKLSPPSQAYFPSFNNTPHTTTATFSCHDAYAPLSQKSDSNCPQNSMRPATQLFPPHHHDQYSSEQQQHHSPLHHKLHQHYPSYDQPIQHHQHQYQQPFNKPTPPKTNPYQHTMQPRYDCYR